MKTKLALLIWILFCKASTAQIAIRGYYYQPLYDFGYFMKPATSLEIGYLPDFGEGYSRINASVTYLKLQSKRAEFVNSSTSGLTVIGMWPYRESQVTRSYQNYEMYQGFFGWDFALIKKPVFQLYVGPGIIIGKLTDAHTVLDESGNSRKNNIPFDKDGAFFTGLRHHIGIQFKINDQLNLLANAQTCYWLYPGNNFFDLTQANDFGIGFQYLFGKANTKQ